MRLKFLKLVGFKSFVDPTTVPFPSNLVGIVGPNGCGKSNVVDAIRWVMGETSAKNLRGESMADVIFNGSSARKPVGQASVELVFDNSDGGLGGEYAKYAEISIKRQVTRDGQSDYFLNGTKCRRKDIVDIFLGTGLGPRSYSVIEQGMISRFIEAKPDDLRIFIEEAAGVSKYKERRKETESRIKGTRENLERLEDLRQEIAKQLENLQKQAKAAERYKILKEEERQTKAQCLALHWQKMDQRLHEQDGAIKELEIKIEAKVAEQRRLGAEIERFRDQHIEVNDEFNEIQAQYYAMGSDIARLEQTITHHRERVQQLRSDQERVERNWQELQSHVTTDQQRIAQFTAELDEMTPALTQGQEAANASEDVFANAEHAMQEWQHQWDSFNQGANEAVQKARVEQTRIQHLEQQIINSEKRLERLQAELAQINFEHLDSQINLSNEQSEEWQEKILLQQNKLAEINEQLHDKRGIVDEVTQELDAVRSRVQTSRGRYASLQALQQAALGSGTGSAKNWLQARQLTQQPRLAQTLIVTNGWERAVETVLGSYLEAVCVEDATKFIEDFATLSEGEVILFDTQTHSAANSSASNLLSHHVKSAYGVEHLLKGVYCADNLQTALSLRAQLHEGESIVTIDGIWFGKNWLRVSKTQDTNNSVIKREKELAELSEQLQTDEQRSQELQADLQTQKAQLVEFESLREQTQRELNQYRDQAHKVSTQLEVQRSSRERLHQRAQQLQTEQAELQQTTATYHEELIAAREIWQAAVNTIEMDEQRKQELSNTRASLRDALDMARDKSRQDKDLVHQLTLRSENARTQLSSAQENITRMEQQLYSLQEQRDRLNAALSEGDAPIKNLQDELQAKLQVRAEEEARLNVARKQVEHLTEQLREKEELKDEVAEAVEGLRVELQQLKLDIQEYAVRRTTYQEQLAELEFHLETVIANLPPEATLEAWEEELQAISNRIQRLGAINLAAIDELAVQEERKVYLDAQYADLTEALTTLENAIRKIDQETKARFEETFQTVNKGFQELFPRVFGGGSAYLELTGDDLLSTGISVIARPPGKRNSSIHLLSGGEKALTAISLVFAIFQLNPAPFCLLDEVDAPLDDSNVVRFCNLVKEMSLKVQFMFISHNKVAIEMANHLAGVTMHEPGVSRIVAVDVEEAVQMATV